MPRFNALADWLTWQEQLHPRTIDLGLDRAMTVLDRLALQSPKPLTITVAGTNGKGSCVAFLEAIYLAQGYRVGAYTSPHILRYNERIRINGQMADDDAICEMFAKIDAVRGDLSLSYFEFGTLTALSLFNQATLDVQLLEVGLGGRLDAVNCVDADATLVTTIGIDHTDWLGDNREAIGREKGGIFRPHVPAIIGDLQPPASLLQTAIEKQAKLLRIGCDIRYQKTAAGWDWACGDKTLNGLPPPAFKGEHQYRNASIVLAAVSWLNDRLAVSGQAIAQGLQQATLQGRFQLIPGDKPVLLDVGHNPQAVQTLFEHLQIYYPQTRIHAVFAMMADKDINGVLSIMRPIVAHWYFAPIRSQRAASSQVLRECFAQQGIGAFSDGFADFDSAFEAANRSAKTGELILIFGSFLLVSAYLARLT